MKCHSVLLLLIVGVRGSFIELNDTVLSKLPPLNGLDEWSSCQRAGDVYCIVDARLGGDHRTVKFLEDYSSQTLKHYNRSVIHRGVCVTRCADLLGAAGAAGGAGSAGEGGWHGAAQHCVDDEMKQYGLQASVYSVRGCTPTTTHTVTTGARALSVCCLLLLVLTVVATGGHLLGDTCTKKTVNKYLLAFSLKQSWAILTFDRNKPRTDDRMKDLAILEGIRVLAMQCVMFSHVLFIYMYAFTDNPQYIEKMYDTFFWQAVMNSPLWLQAFFSLSAFLTAYTLLVCAERQPMTLVKGLMSVASRWVRLTPAAVFALWFTIWWLPLLGSGPQWWWAAARESQECGERWWYHVLYVHNHLPLGKFCMGHTWYLAVDMQLHIFGVLLILALLKWRSAVMPVLATLLALSAIIPGLVAYFYDLAPIVTVQAPESVRNLFTNNTTLSMLYIPSYMNLAGYVTGVAAAFMLHGNQKRNVELSESKWFSLLFHLALTLGGCVVLAGAVFLQDDPPPQLFAAIYSGLDRTIVAVFFSVFLLGCVSRCRSLLASMLRWRGFHALGRLSYCAFLIHFIVLRLTVAADTRLLHASGMACVSLLITVSVLTYIASIPLCLLVEIPCCQLWKAATERDERARVAPAQVVRPAAVKPFDLVAHVSRNHDRV